MSLRTTLSRTNRTTRVRIPGEVHMGRIQSGEGRVLIGGCFSVISMYRTSRLVCLVTREAAGAGAKNRRLWRGN